MKSNAIDVVISMSLFFFSKKSNVSEGPDKKARLSRMIQMAEFMSTFDRQLSGKGRYRSALII